jgi:beta-N-acetylhexosaminidase
MIGQLIIVGFHGEGGDNLEIIKKQIEGGEIGGVILLEHNIGSRENLRKITEQIHGIRAKHIPFIAIDQEGGLVARMDSSNGFVDFPSAEEVGQKSPEEAYKIYSQMAKLLEEYHINLNFVPCVDIRLNEKSLISRRKRSYGNTVSKVCQFAQICIKAHAERNIATSLKHFPGHGSCGSDTHETFSDATQVWSEEELEPYGCLLNGGDNMDLTMVMTSHIFNRNWDVKYPASLSKNVIQGMLRSDLKFDGVVISDDLDMKAVAGYHSLEEIVLQALNAGNDILLFANYLEFDAEIASKCRKIIVKAIADNKLDRKRIEESFYRVIALKRKIADTGAHRNGSKHRRSK